MAFTAEFTFGDWQSGMYDEPPTILFRTIRKFELPPISGWILATGFWDDLGTWEDSAAWID